MKKRTKLLLMAVCLLTLLTGCYKQDTQISVGPMGNIHAEITLMGTDDSVAQVSGGGDFSQLKDSLLPQINGMITDTAKEKCEVVSEDVNGTKLNGMKLTCYYSSFEDMEASQLFYAYNSSVAVPVLPGEAQEGAPGLAFSSKSGFFGTNYKIAGTISMTQGQEVIQEELDKLKSASASLTFKFPFGSFTASAGNKNIVMPTFKFEATTENDNIPVNVSVFVPNYLVMLGILIMIGLIVAVILLSLKIKKLNAIIAGEGEDAAEVSTEEFVSEDDKQFFEGSEETVDFTQAPVAEETVDFTQAPVTEETVVETVEEIKEEVLEEEKEETDNQ